MSERSRELALEGGKMDARTTELSEWASAQHRFGVEALLHAISATTLVKRRPAMRQTVRPARGSILASPAMAAYDPKPDYFFHWLRDSALAADALREAIEGGALAPTAIEHLVDFVEFNLGLCSLDGPSFLREGGYPEEIEPSFQEHIRSRAEIAEIVGDAVLGEARYNPDGSLDLLKWGRPQNDGPALRALTVMRCFALEAFPAKARESAVALLRYDLDYTLSHWRSACCDIWEETIGFHYHTRLAQQAALEAGAKFFASERDEPRARACAAAARELLVELDRHFDAEDGVYRGRLPETGPNTPALRRLDVAVILATIQAGRRAGRHSVVDPRTLSTLRALERLFEGLYPINRARPADSAPALGRYPDDRYFSGGAYYFSTLGAAQFYFLFAQAVAEGVELSVTDVNREALVALLQPAAVSLQGGALAPRLRIPLAAAAMRRGDMYLETVRQFTPASHEMAEQFSQIDGAPNSADDLTWNYACFVTALATRRRAAQATLEATGV